MNVCLAQPKCSNIGNAMSSPTFYFDLPDTRLIDVQADGFEVGDVTIVAKGWLNDPNVSLAPLHRKRTDQEFVIWGCGLERATEREVNWPMPTWLDRCALVGVRDWGRGYRWVPDASCMHDIFDEADPGPIQKFSALSYTYNRLPNDGLPHMCNHHVQFRDVIDHIRAGETLITTSYHAAYWATLLGRRVVVVNPRDVKWYALRFKHPLVSEWRSGLAEARVYPEALKECRAANRAFYADVLDLMNR